MGLACSSLSATDSRSFHFPSDSRQAAKRCCQSPLATLKDGAKFRLRRNCLPDLYDEVKEILDGAKMNLPLMEEVTKRAQKARADNQTNLFEN